MTAVSGPGFISLQVRDVPASATFYEEYLGFTRQAGPPNAVVFDAKPASFAVRPPLPGVDLGSVHQLGLGVGIWLHAPEAQQVHDRLVADGYTITAPPIDGPFGRQFTFADPDGYQITLHDLLK
ncbi:VOC family protein [Glaciihabitans arcticus]|uniref:VOC family protein n=1 Tax=Glaciihabitans arcticus TaxID=2668039 RepID=A0A4Q9GRX2_9MICO|nr:VOC family protein [Glaciihabitans arcticus]TBN55534.1 VOC family protein [Glaciihabitans arcticus]